MKKQITRALAITALLLGPAANTSQTFAARATGRLVFDVPFEFVAGGKTLPAGRYAVTHVTHDAARVLLIRREDGRASVTVQTLQGEADGELPRVSFKRYGERYFLSLVSAHGGESARALPASSLEKQLRRELAKAKKTKGGEANVAETVTVSARVR